MLISLSALSALYSSAPGGRQQTVQFRTDSVELKISHLETLPRCQETRAMTIVTLPVLGVALMSLLDTHGSPIVSLHASP